MSQAPLSADQQAADLAAYYADGKLLRRNLFFIMFTNWGQVLAGTVTGPLILMRMKASGVDASLWGTLTSANLWAVSFLVMYFSWKSDHTVTRFGRRIPYLFISAPFTIIVLLVYPFVTDKRVLVGLWIVQAFFMDIKASTYPLLSIDCVPRRQLARVGALMAIVTGVTQFVGGRYLIGLADWIEWFPYALCAVVLAVVTLIGGLMIKEPPIRNPATESFKPWSTLKIGFRDRRVIWLVLASAAVLGFTVVYGQWVWYFAKDTMNLERTDIAKALAWAPLLNIMVAYPGGWIIDRFSGYKVTFLYCLMNVGAYAFVTGLNTPGELIIMSFVVIMLASLSNAAGLMIIRHAKPEEMGSVTSSASFIRNMTMGMIIWISGELIDMGQYKNYQWAFTFGLCVTLAGLVLLLIYRRLMRRSVPVAVAGSTGQPAALPEADHTPA